MPDINGNLSKEEIEALQMRFYNDPVDFMQTCLGRWFYKPLSWMHRGFVALMTGKTRFLSKYGELEKIKDEFVYRYNDPWDDSEQAIPIFRWGDETKTWLTFTATRFQEIMCPRGVGKTTLGEGVLTWMGCFKERNFVLLLGETATHAENIQRNIRYEFETNELIRMVFGDLCGKGTSGCQWNDQQFELLNGFVMACTGRGGQVRGRNVKGQRPDFIYLDDVEDKESVNTREQIEKTRAWFTGDVMPAMGEIAGDGRILLCGTLLDKEALLVTVGKDPTFTTIVFGALDQKGEPIFESYMTKEKLEAKKAFYERMGQIDLFYLEYFNTISNDETRSLKESYVQYGTRPGKPLALAMAVDPAISKKKSADDTAFGIVALYPGCQIVLHKVVGYKGLTPQDTLQIFWELKNKYWKQLPWDEASGSPAIPTFIGLETVAYQEALYDLMREEQVKRGDYFDICKIRFNQEKKARILGTLEPRYRTGLIWHAERFPEYESQMKDFPKGHDDLLDVVSMAIHLLEPIINEAASQGLDSTEEASYTDYDTPILSGGI